MTVLCQDVECDFEFVESKNGKAYWCKDVVTYQLPWQQLKLFNIPDNKFVKDITSRAYLNYPINDDNNIIKFLNTIDLFMITSKDVLKIAGKKTYNPLYNKDKSTFRLKLPLDENKIDTSLPLCKRCLSKDGLTWEKSDCGIIRDIDELRKLVAGKSVRCLVKVKCLYTLGTSYGVTLAVNKLEYDCTTYNDSERSNSGDSNGFIDA